MGDVKLWFAKDEHNNIIAITDVDKTDLKKYYCPLCGSDLIPRQGKKMSWHFAHVDKSKCTTEAAVHWWVKNQMIKIGDVFKINTDSLKEYYCKSVQIEKTIETSHGLYRPDLIIETQCGSIIYVEIKNTNKKKLKDYIDIWSELKNIVVEIDINDFYETLEEIIVFKAVYYNGKCLNVDKNDVYYNLIGMQKELAILDLEYQKRLIEIKKLDWLWDTIYLYKTGIVKIVDMIDSLMSITDEKDRETAISILNKNNCNNVKKDIVNYYKININLFMETQISKNCALTYKIIVPKLLVDKFYNGLSVDIYAYNIVLLDRINMRNLSIDTINNLVESKESELKIGEIVNDFKTHYSNYANIVKYNKCSTPYINYDRDDYYGHISVHYLNGVQRFSKDIIYNDITILKESIRKIIEIEDNESFSISKIINIDKTIEKVKKNLKIEDFEIIFKFSTSNLEINLKYLKNNCTYATKDQVLTFLNKDDVKYIGICIKLINISNIIKREYLCIKNKSKIIDDLKHMHIQQIDHGWDLQLTHCGSGIGIYKNNKYIKELLYANYNTKDKLVSSFVDGKISYNDMIDKYYKEFSKITHEYVKSKNKEVSNV